MSRLILLTGATGYVGGRLLPLLVANGFPVRCMARKVEYLRARVASGVEVVQGDALDPASLHHALTGAGVAYYLVHSMGSSGDFAAADREAAKNFGDAARQAGVARIIYLGGLAEEGADLSPHLQSRREVGEVLRASGVPVVEFRASIIIGSGSLSFEMVRALVERLPVMITPKWVEVPAQPIFIDDILAYLLAAANLETTASRTFEIGGREVVSYGGLMREYARQRGLRRWTLRVPVLTPRLSSLWLGLVTPLYARVGRKLIDSIRHPTVVRDCSALSEFKVKPLGVAESISRAIRNEDAEMAVTRWSDALSAAGSAAGGWGGARFGNRLVDSRTARVRATPEAAFAAVERIGGDNGWYYGDWLWTLRGWLDLLVGGVGMRRGRRHPRTVRVGEALDCWRVDLIEPGRRLLLAAEMRVPGRAWLEFEVNSEADRKAAVIRQTATFDPLGLAGLAYWYGVWPVHQFVFAGMLRGLARTAESLATEDREDDSGSPTVPGVAPGNPE